MRKKKFTSKKPLVSIITLTYNNFSSIEENIKSVSSQTYKNFEYIICDDGSNNFDDTYIQGILKKYHVEKFKIIKNNINNGTVRNFNIAFRSSSGEILIPLSQDDQFSRPDVVDHIVNYFITYNSDLLTGRRNCVDDQGKTVLIKPIEYQRQILLKNDREKVLEELFKYSFVSGACTSYSRVILEKYHGFNEDYRLIEDFPFYAKYVLDGGKIDYLDECIINYGLNGITSKKTKTSIILTNDREKYLKEIIKPNYKHMPFIVKREILYRFHEMYHRNNGIFYYLEFLKYIDFVVYLACKKLNRLLFSK